MVHDLRSRRGRAEGTKTVWGGLTNGDCDDNLETFSVDGVGVMDDSLDGVDSTLRVG